MLSLHSLICVSQRLEIIQNTLRQGSCLRSSFEAMTQDVCVCSVNIRGKLAGILNCYISIFLNFKHWQVDDWRLFFVTFKFSCITRVKLASTNPSFPPFLQPIERRRPLSRACKLLIFHGRVLHSNCTIRAKLAHIYKSEILIADARFWQVCRALLTNQIELFSFNYSSTTL